MSKNTSAIEKRLKKLSKSRKTLTESMVLLDQTRRKLKKSGFNSESNQVKKVMLEVSVAIDMMTQEASQHKKSV
jgi:hypothetical protein